MHNVDTLSDEDLVSRAADPQARAQCVAVLYRRHVNRVTTWCLRLSHDENEALDVAQEVFIRVERALDSFREDSRFTTWLYVIARRTAIDHLRRAQQARERTVALHSEPSDDAATPEEEAQRAQMAQQLNRDMNRLLAPEEAQVVYMHYSLGMTLPAITRSLGLTNSSGAKAPLVAAMRKLRRHYNVVPGASTGAVS